MDGLVAAPSRDEWEQGSWPCPASGAEEDIDRCSPELVAAYDHWVITRSESDFEDLLDTLCERWDGLTLVAPSGSVSDALEERFPLLAEEAGFWSVVDALSLQDDETFEEEPPSGSRARSIGRAAARVVGVLLVILALLAYFTAPFGNTTTSAQVQGQRPSVRPIPLSPEPNPSPRLLV